MDAVILDVGGVLLVPHFEELNSALGAFGVQLDADGAQRAHYAGVRALDAAVEDAQAERLAYLVGYAAQAGIAPSDRDAAVARMQVLWSGPSIDLWRQRVSGSADGLRQLAASGYKLGIVSNADGSIEEQLKRNQICQVGEGLGVPVLAIVDSHVVQIAKPAAAIFRHALDPLQVDPSAAVYVGDTIRYDIRGARAAGIQPVHFDPYELCSELADHPHVKSLSDLAQQLPH